MSDWFPEVQMNWPKQPHLKMVELSEIQALIHMGTWATLLKSGTNFRSAYTLRLSRNMRSRESPVIYEAPRPVHTSPGGLWAEEECSSLYEWPRVSAPGNLVEGTFYGGMSLWPCGISLEAGLTRTELRIWAVSPEHLLDLYGKSFWIISE